VVAVLLASPDAQALSGWTGLAGTLPAGPRAGVVATPSRAWFFSGTDRIEYDLVSERVVGTSDLRAVAGWPPELAEVTAATPLDATRLLFVHQQKDATGAIATVAQVLTTADDRWSPVDASLGEALGMVEIDALVCVGDDLYLFSGSEFIVYSLVQHDFTKRAATSTWEGWPAEWSAGITCALLVPDLGTCYFRGVEYLWSTDAGLGRVESYGVVPGRNVQSDAPNVSRKRPTLPQSTTPAVATTHGNAPVASATDEPAPAPAAAKPAAVADGSGYWEDFEAITPNDQAWHEFSSQVLQNWDWLAAGYDLVSLDPRFNNSEDKKRSAIQLSLSRQRAEGSGKWLKQWGTRYMSGSGLDIKGTNSIVTSQKDFAGAFGVSASAVGGMEGVAFTASAAYQQVNTASNGSSEVMVFNRATVKTVTVAMDLTWHDYSSNKDYRQRLEPEFRAAIAALPAPASLPSVMASQLKKGEPMPAGLQQLRPAYDALIATYGTHFSKEVTFGGQYIEVNRVSRETFAKSRMDAFQFQAALRVDAKAATVGGGAGVDVKQSNSSSGSSERGSTEIWATGGGNSPDRNEWAKGVASDLAPVSMKFAMLSELLVPQFFPGDKALSSKKKVLELMISQHMLDLAEPDRFGTDFWSAASGTKSAGEPVYIEVSVTDMVCTGQGRNEPGDVSEYYGKIFVDVFSAESRRKFEYGTCWEVGSGSSAIDMGTNAVNPINWTKVAGGTEPHWRDGTIRMWGEMHESEGASGIFDGAVKDTDLDNFAYTNTPAKIDLDQVLTGQKAVAGQLAFTSSSGDAVTVYFTVKKVPAPAAR